MNDELVALLKGHAQQYPCMQVRDAVKLIYQNEMGPGHMVKSEADSLRRLETEFQNAQASGPFFEDIGNGLCRMYLGALKDEEIELSTVNRFFLHTANTHQGSVPALEDKLTGLVEACRRGELPFSVEGVESFIQEQRSQGYPPISHSDEYRRQYAPAYRVVQATFRDYISLFARIDALQKTQTPFNVAIDGMSCSGKSTLAALLGKVYDCNLFHMDDFFLPRELKTKERLDEPGGNVDYERFRQEVLVGLTEERPFSYRPFSCKSQALVEPVQVSPKPLNIVEGAYSLHPSLEDAYQLKVFLKIEPEVQSARILHRNGPAMHERFLKEWVPLENRYFHEYNIEDRCDLVFGYKKSSATCR